MEALRLGERLLKTLSATNDGAVKFDPLIAYQ